MVLVGFNLQAVIVLYQQDLSQHSHTTDWTLASLSQATASRGHGTQVTDSDPQCSTQYSVGTSHMLIYLQLVRTTGHQYVKPGLRVTSLPCYCHRETVFTAKPMDQLSGPLTQSLKHTLP